MAGEVLFAGFSEQVAVESMGTIGTGGASGRPLEQLRQRLAIIQQEGDTGPFAGEQLVEQCLRGERDIESRAFVPGHGQASDQSPSLRIGRFAVDGFSQGAVRQHPHAKVDPPALEEAQAAEGLSIKQLVGNEDTGPAELSTVA